MTEKDLCYSTVVPFSCIPEEFLQPLVLEDAGDYTIDDDQFPGLSGEEHRREPALILAHPEMVHTSPRQDFPSPIPNRSPVTVGGVVPETWSHHHQQQHHIEKTNSWINYHPQMTSNQYHGFTTQTIANPSYEKPACETINKAREDLFTIISGIQHKGLSNSSNPFDAMPALLSAVSFDYMSNHAPVQGTCQSRSRASRQHYVKRKMVSHVSSLPKPIHPTEPQHGPKYANDIANISEILNQGQSRKRTYQVDDLDDILQCEYGNTKRRRVLETNSPQCWPYQKENIPTYPYNPMAQFSGNIGIIGY